MIKQVVVERISEIISRLEQDNETTTTSIKFDEGFESGTELALALLREWLRELV